MEVACAIIYAVCIFYSCVGGIKVDTLIFNTCIIKEDIFALVAVEVKKMF